MHDPMSVAHEIKYPWRQSLTIATMNGKTTAAIRYRPPMVTIWHRDPSGYDSGVRCRMGPEQRWRWHVHHWRLQIHPLQRIRRAVQRCAGCGQRFGWNPPALIAAGWDDPRTLHPHCYKAWRP